MLPVLNNLLENREMQLEDGRFLMSAERYDKLLRVREGKPAAGGPLLRVGRVCESALWAFCLANCLVNHKFI